MHSGSKSSDAMRSQTFVTVKHEKSFACPKLSQEEWEAEFGGN